MESNNTEIIYDKPFKTYDELIAILESRNVVISNKEKAKRVLSDISYYTLINGYKDIFPMENDTFIYPINFNDLYFLYHIDITLNNLLLKYILHIERSLKTKIAYRISEQYGVYTDYNDLSNTNHDDYLCRNYYTNNNMRNNVLCSIKDKISNSKHLSVIHYRQNHNHIPFWIAMNALPLGLTIKFYQILSKNDKEYVCEEFISSPELTIEDKKEFLLNALAILKEYRNGIAHGNKIYTSSVKSKLPKRGVLRLSNNCITTTDYRNGLGLKDLLAVIIIIFVLTRDEIREQFLIELKVFFSNYSHLSCMGKSVTELLSLPNDINSRIEKLK